MNALLKPSIHWLFIFIPVSVVMEHLLNIGITVVLLITYGLYLLFSLKTHPGVFTRVESGGGGHAEESRWSVARAVGTLIAASLLAAWMSEILVGAAEGTGKALGMTQTFIGMVFLAIVGGAAESGSAIAMARKNKLDLSAGILLAAQSSFGRTRPGEIELTK